MALDLILKNLLHSQEFQSLNEDKWNAVSNIVPGTTPRQCLERFEQLSKKSASSVGADILSTSPWQRPSSSTFRTDSAERCENSGPLRPFSAKSKAQKSEKESVASKPPGNYSRSLEQSPVMVIHVCDEAKNLKQDFNCPRDLLISEMKYFAEYLSTDPQRLEEVDISVHCDVHIFDWLMKYVKRKSKENSTAPALETTNVISILISSYFLKMDTLVEECVEFCHKKMSTIVATPCNMNCINDSLVTRIAQLFDHNEADNIKDRKDKFKSKLFSKLLERLFDGATINPDSPESAATLYRCSVCKSLLTKKLEKKMPCLLSRLVIDERGALCYSHTRDPAWDVNDWLLSLWQQTKQWRDVYWRVWGSVNFLECTHCNQTFPCSQLPFCAFHPQPAEFSTSSGAIGVWPCCQEKVFRFDPSYVSQGCLFRDHVVKLPPDDSTEPEDISQRKVFTDLLAHREVICMSIKEQPANSVVEINVFSSEESALSELGITSTVVFEESNKTEPRLHPLTVDKQMSYDDDLWTGESDDEIGDDEEVKAQRFKSRRSRVTVDPQAILLDAPDFSTTKTRKWDSSRSLRWNQDAQREEDGRRMKDIVRYLTRLRLSPEKAVKHKEYSGGIYCKLEAQWRTSSMSANSTTPKTVNQPARSKTRTSMFK